MVATSETPSFSPDGTPRVSIASDGTLAAIAEPSRVVVLELPSTTPFAEIGIDPDAAASEVAWIGAPPRLLVLSRYAAHSTAHLIDPYGPRTIAEIRLESPMKLLATVGAHALAIGAATGVPGAAILTATETHLTPYQFPSRGTPTTAGAAATSFVVAIGGSIEEWDPKNRMPKRRLRLARPAAITSLGGSDRVVWMTTQQEPARLDVIPLVNRGQPKAHDLPEPIALASGHPRSDLVVCVGAETGRCYVVDLDGRSRLRVVGPEGIARTEAAGLVVGRMTGVLAAQAAHPVAIVQLEGQGEAAAPSPAPVASATPAPATPARASVPAGSTLGGDGEEEDAEAEGEAAAPPRSTLGAAEDDDEAVDVDLEDDAAAILEERPATDAGDARASSVAEAAGGEGDAVDAEHAAQVVDADAAGPAAEVDADAEDEAAADVPAQSPAPARASDPPPRPSPVLAPVAPRPVPPAPAPPAAQPVPSAPPAARPVPSAPAPARPASPAPAPTSWPSVFGPPATPGGAAADDRLSNWRERIRPGQARDVAPHASWRDQLVTWARGIAGGSMSTSAPAAPPIAELARRFELPDALVAGLALLYGAHLAGERGAAPVDVARVLGGRWDEALGGGILAAHELAIYADSRVLLAPALRRALDELPPASGTLVGEAGVSTLLGPCAIVSADASLRVLAAQHAGVVRGAILVAHDDADPADVFLEARARGAAPMLRITAGDLLEVGTDPAILVVPDEATADELGVPRLG